MSCLGECQVLRQQGARSAGEGCGRGYLYKVHCGQAGARGLGEGTREPEDQAEEAAEVSPSWPSQWGNRDRAKGGEEAELTGGDWWAGGVGAGEAQHRPLARDAFKAPLGREVA